jgi:DNA-binding transcriptional MerR regulator
MEIKEYAKTSKIPLKTLRWMERIKTISDPLPDDDLIGLKLVEKLWGMHDFLRPQLSQKNIKYRKALIETCDLETKWERYAFSRFMNLEPSKRLFMKNLIAEIELTHRFKMSIFEIKKLYRVRKRVHKAKERQVQKELKEEQNEAVEMSNNDLEKSERAIAE